MKWASASLSKDSVRPHFIAQKGADSCPDFGRFFRPIFSPPAFAFSPDFPYNSLHSPAGPDAMRGRIGSADFELLSPSSYWRRNLFISGSPATPGLGIGMTDRPLIDAVFIRKSNG
jgi:hypothetical protein